MSNDHATDNNPTTPVKPVVSMTEQSQDKKEIIVDAGLIDNLSRLLKISLKPVPEKHKEGMSLDEQCEQIRFYSMQTSAINRSLALAGIAIIWLFKNPDKQGIITHLLNLPLLLLGISLALDLLQYFWGTIMYRRFYGKKLELWKTNKMSDENSGNIMIPGYIKTVIDWIFYAKIMTMMAAYIFIILYLTKVL